MAHQAAPDGPTHIARQSVLLAPGTNSLQISARQSVPFGGQIYANRLLLLMGNEYSVLPSGEISQLMGSGRGVNARRVRASAVYRQWCLRRSSLSVRGS